MRDLIRGNSWNCCRVLAARCGSAALASVTSCKMSAIFARFASLRELIPLPSPRSSHRSFLAGEEGADAALRRRCPSDMILCLSRVKFCLSSSFVGALCLHSRPIRGANRLARLLPKHDDVLARQDGERLDPLERQRGHFLFDLGHGHLMQRFDRHGGIFPAKLDKDNPAAGF
jgi:hypothetical protein